MAIQVNGQDIGPIKFTDDRGGKTIHVGPFLPNSAADGDIWIDADAQNNAGKNLVQSINLGSVVGQTVNVSVDADYKDYNLVFRNFTLSQNANVTFTVNNDVVSYIDNTGTPSTALITVPNVKAGITTNKFALNIADIQDSTSYSLAVLEGVYRNVANNIIPVLTPGIWLQVQPITSVRISISAGGFAGGTLLVYGVN